MIPELCSSSVFHLLQGTDTEEAELNVGRERRAHVEIQL